MFALERVEKDSDVHGFKADVCFYVLRRKGIEGRIIF